MKPKQIEIETIEDGGGCYVAGVRTLSLEEFEELLKKERYKVVDNAKVIMEDLYQQSKKSQMSKEKKEAVGSWLVGAKIRLENLKI